MNFTWAEVPLEARLESGVPELLAVTVPAPAGELAVIVTGAVTLMPVGAVQLAVGRAVVQKSTSTLPSDVEAPAGTRRLNE